MKYNLTAHVTISVYTEVEADSEEEAIEIAKKRDVCQVNISSSYTPDEFWIAGEELDGEPTKIRIDE